MDDRSMTRPLASRLSRGLVVAGVALALAAGCSSGSTDDVVAGPASTTGNPQTPAVDNPTSTTTSPASTATTSPASTTTTDPDAAATTAPSTPTTDVTLAPAVTVADGSVVDGTLTMQLFWVRTPGDPRPLELPGYRDPESGPKPLVLYGSATNATGAAVAAPRVVAVFRDSSGQAIAAFAAPVLRAGSATPATSLAPGESGDVVLVIDGPAAEQLADAAPELRGGAAA